MAITAGITTEQRRRWIESLQEDTLMVALYTSAANLEPDSLVIYSTVGEVVGTGYTAGGMQLQNASVIIDANAAVLDFDDVVWSNVTITARAALIYNASESNRAIAVLDFVTDRETAGGDFTLVVPSATTTTGIIRITPT